MPETSIPALMPFWVRHFPLLLALGALPFTYLVTALAVRLSGSREPVPAGPWYARARALWPQQAVARQAQLVFPFVLAALLPLVRGPVMDTPGWLVSLLAYPLSLYGAALAARAFLASAGVERPLGPLVRGVLVWLLVVPLGPWLALVGMNAVEELEGGPRVVVALVFLAATAAAPLGMGVYLARAVGMASRAGPVVAAASEAAAAASGHRPRFVWEIDLAQANALALVWLQGVVVSRKLVGATAPDELEAIIRHELGHLREPLAVRAGRLALPVALCWTLVLSRVVVDGVAGAAGSWGLLAGVWALVGWMGVLLVAALLLRRLGRRMEHRADQELGGDHAAYARGLEKLYADNLVPAVTGERRLSHPELYDRMAAAGHPPPWPRPDPPRRTRAGRVVLVLALVVPLEVAVSPRVFPPPALALRSEVDVVLGGGRDGTLFGLARGWMKERRREEARALLLALASQDSSGFAGVSAAGVLAEGGFCAEARRMAAERELLHPGNKWSGWLRVRLEDCSDGQTFVRDEL